MHSTTTIDLLRHGACEGGDIYRGSTDVELTPAGWRQMLKSSEALWFDWQAIVSSPLLRCSQFALHAASELGLDLAEDKNFSEIHFGRWEGCDRQQIWDNDRYNVERWLDDPLTHHAPDGEATQIFFDRVTAAFKQLYQSSKGKHIATVTHGGVIRAVLSSVLSGDAQALNRFDVPYASVSRIRVWHTESGDFPQLVFHNSVTQV